MNLIYLYEQYDSMNHGICFQKQHSANILKFTIIYKLKFLKCKFAHVA